jgi:hypothetical protein
MKKKAHELFGCNGDAAFADTIYLTVLANVLGTKAGFTSTDGETGDYSSVWTVERDWENRTSLITDPPDGRLPAMTPEAQARREAVRAALRRPAAGPQDQDRSLSERCITYGSPQLMKQWFGDSRGHWEGDTLVVDTTNYKARAFMSVSSEKLHVIERYSRRGPETLKYEITIDDPATGRSHGAS